jgi:C1A family cysteine protease
MDRGRLPDSSGAVPGCRCWSRRDRPEEQDLEGRNKVVRVGGSITKHETLRANLVAGCLLALAAIAGTLVGASDAVAWSTGHRPAPRDLTYLGSTPVRSRTLALQAYPASYDLRSVGRVSSVKDQNPYGTCWAFAALGSLESGLLRSDPTPWDLSEDNLVWFSGFSLPDAYESGGNSFMALAYLARWGGPVTEADDAYADGLHPLGRTPQLHLREAVFVPPRSSSADNEQIKAAVMQYGGVDVDMWWPEVDASSYWNEPTSSLYTYGTHSTNHDVLIVGWDDAFPAESFASQPPGPGAFIVKNSWGAAWGDGGFFYVSYYDDSLARGGYNMAFTTAGVPDDYSRVYQYDPLGYWPGDGPAAKSATGWFANSFTAAAAGELAAVGFYTPLPGCSYEISTSDAAGLPTFSSLQVKGSGTLATAGYHVVPLSSAVPLTLGRPFTVAVKLTAPDPSFHDLIPAELPYAGYSDASSNPGESFVSTDEATWRDLTSIPGYGEANVCLKAFAVEDGKRGPVVLTPDGGEDWPIGTQRTITWSGAGPGTTSIKLSRDGGATFSETIAGDTANDGTYSWTVTGPESRDAKVRVATVEGEDVSDLTFTISAPAAGDTEPPVTTSSGALEGRWYKDEVVISLTATDGSDGSGIDYTEYSLDGGGWMRGSSVRVNGDGRHALLYRSGDRAGNVEVSRSLGFAIDTARPRTLAPDSARARRGRSVSLKFRVLDPLPNGGTATVLIKVKTRTGKLVKTLRPGVKPVNSALALRFTVPRTWRARTYRFFVYATDKAGNRQAAVASNRLIVR